MTITWITAESVFAFLLGSESIDWCARYAGGKKPTKKYYSAFSVQHDASIIYVLSLFLDLSLPSNLLLPHTVKDVWSWPTPQWHFACWSLRLLDENESYGDRVPTSWQGKNQEHFHLLLHLYVPCMHLVFSWIRLDPEPWERSYRGLELRWSKWW